MTQSKVIDKLSIECHSLVEQFPDDKYAIIRKYIQMALVVGLEHFSTEMKEIVVLDYNGVERGRFKSIQDAANKLGIHSTSITAVVNGRQHTAGGYMFMKKSNYELLRRPSEKINP